MACAHSTKSRSTFRCRRSSLPLSTTWPLSCQALPSESSATRAPCEEVIVDAAERPKRARLDRLDVEWRAGQLLDEDHQIGHLQRGEEALLDDLRVVADVAGGDLVVARSDPSAQPIEHLGAAHDNVSSSRI